MIVTDSVAASNVEVIEYCLNTPPDEHVMECEEEWWHAELGERPAMYMGFSAHGALGAFIFAALSWDYWRNQP